MNIQKRKQVFVKTISDSRKKESDISLHDTLWLRRPPCGFAKHRYRSDGAYMHRNKLCPTVSVVVLTFAFMTFTRVICKLYLRVVDV